MRRPMSSPDDAAESGPKARTRRLLSDAAHEPLRTGAPLIVAAAAELPGLSRATAYRYFPGKEAAILHAIMPLTETCAATGPDDAESAGVLRKLERDRLVTDDLLANSFAPLRIGTRQFEGADRNAVPEGRGDRVRLVGRAELHLVARLLGLNSRSAGRAAPTRSPGGDPAGPRVMLKVGGISGQIATVPGFIGLRACGSRNSNPFRTPHRPRFLGSLVRKQGVCPTRLDVGL
jgi:hypothetical protein